MLTAVLLLVVAIPFVRGRVRRSLAAKPAAPVAAVAAGLAAAPAAAAPMTTERGDSDGGEGQRVQHRRVFAPSSSVLTALSSSQGVSTSHIVPVDV